jgi:hypothetical protein
MLEKADEYAGQNLGWLEAARGGHDWEALLFRSAMFITPT